MICRRKLRPRIIDFFGKSNNCFGRKWFVAGGASFAILVLKIFMVKKIKFQTPTGMRDILPEDQIYFQKIKKICGGAADFYNFKRIETPIIESAELFSRGVGPSTEITEKQMYALKTKGEDALVLRPEGTASVARAYLERGMSNLPQPVKLWYWGPFFRHERPQAGRYRQFWQFGFEALGEGSSIVDAQIIQIFYNILKELKFKNLLIEINSIGDKHCRPYYRKLLVSYFKSRESSLCSDCRRRLGSNPLRILDCKEEKCRRIISQAPQIIDHLCDECNVHFKQVLEFLDELELPYHLNPYLVRGLDYYTKTVFEINDKTITDDAGDSLALAGGGRYDDLVKLLGGGDVPACGGAAGVERIVRLLRKSGVRAESKEPSRLVFLAQLGESARKKSLILSEKFRKAGICIMESFGKDSLKTQLSRADKAGVRYCLILGQKEAIEKTVLIRDMKTGRQETVKFESVVGEIKKRLKK